MMNCNIYQEKITAYIEGELKPLEADEIRNHLQRCDTCRQMVRENERLLNLMEKVAPVNPDESIRENFMMELQREKTRISSEKGSKNWKTWYSYAAAVALLFVGFMLGRGVGESGNRYEDQLTEMQAEMESMKQLLTVSMLKDESASERIQAVNLTDGFERPSKDVLTTLITTLNQDESPNVRMAAAKALGKFNSDEYVRLSLIKSFDYQTDPMVQIYLIDLMTEIKDKRALKPFKELMEDEKVNEVVKQQAKIGSALLI